jgi:hypothetical protein
MVFSRRCAAVPLLLTIAAGGALFAQGDGAAPPDAGAQRVRAHVEFLADDLMEGREAGTRGYDLAANYVAAVMRTDGVAPVAADGSFFQQVPLRSGRVTDGQVTIAPRTGGRVTLKPRDEVVVIPDFGRPSVNVSAPVVYVGFGVTAPEQQYDDYAGLDVNGRIVLIMSGAPPRFATEPRAHYAGPNEKLRNAVAHGAAGVLFTFQPSDLKSYPWDRLAEAAAELQVVWLDPQGRPGGNYDERLRGRGLLSPDGLRRLLAQAPAGVEQVYQAAEKGEPKGFEIPATATIRTTTALAAIRSANVVGVLRGSDPALADTYVVLTAHLDHVGLGRAVNGDRIYNGAFDNALGSAILLEVARRLAAAPERPRRSVMFAFVTAEEKGLIGSDYFANYPPVPKPSLVANVNLDMPLLQWPIDDVVAFGAENSSLEDVVRRSLAEAGLRLAPDPMPQENIFVRSDQYSLVRQGVPAVFLMPAFGSKDPARDGGQIFQNFLATHYHQPSDDLKLPMDLAAVSAFTRANYSITVAIANDPTAPAWKQGNFFGGLFAR